MAYHAVDRPGGAQLTEPLTDKPLRYEPSPQCDVAHVATAAVCER
ncbi:MAG: hypothetical protein ABI603_01325 [Acidobacteriota bacterium]